jgi:hypothetical protein
LQRSLPTPKEELAIIKEEREDSEKPAFIEEKPVGTRRSSELKEDKTEVAVKKEQDSEQEMDTDPVYRSFPAARNAFKAYLEAKEAISTGNAAKDGRFNDGRHKRVMEDLQTEYVRRILHYEINHGKTPSRVRKQRIHAAAIEDMKQKLAQDKAAASIKIVDCASV